MYADMLERVRVGILVSIGKLPGAEPSMGREIVGLAGARKVEYLE